MTLAPGTRIGPYEVLAPIGAGGMGEVYRAQDTRLGRQVAMKVLPQHLSEDPDAIVRFEREAKAVAYLSHPNILALHDFGTHEGRIYAVMELLEGETLRERLRAGPLPVRKVVEYGVSMARGTAAAHDKGIVHRDLKPENVFLTKDGNLKILDFGLAKQHQIGSPGGDDSETARMEPATRPGVVMGTVGYMSPEQVRGQPVDHRSDIFSLGVVLYEMLTGRRAFEGGSEVERLHAILKEDPPDASEVAAQVPPTLGRVVRRCLEKSPEERFQSSRDLAFALDAVSTTSGTQPEESARLASSSRRRKRLRTALIAMSAVLAAAVFSLGVFTGWQKAEKPVPLFRQIAFRDAVVWDAKFGADGQTVFYTATPRGTGDGVLYSTSLQTGEVRKIGSAIAIVGAQSEEVQVLNWRGVLERVPLSGGAPREVMTGAFRAHASLDGQTFAIVRYEQQRCRLEFPVGHVLHDSSAGISMPRISPRGDLVAFVENSARGDTGGSVAVVDLAGKKRTISREWSDVRGMAWGPNGKELWISAGESGRAHSLYAITLSGDERLLLQIPGIAALLDVDRNGRVLLGNIREQTSARFAVAGDQRSSDLTWLDATVPADLSSDGRSMLFSEVGEGGGTGYVAFIRGTEGSPAMKIGEGEALAISPDGRSALILIVRPSQQLVIAPTGAGEPRKLQRGSIADFDFATWFPDGQKVLIAGNEAGRPLRLWMQQVTGGLPRPVSAEGITLEPGMHTVSPDGRYVVARDAGWFPVLCSFDGAAPQQLRGVTRGDFPLRWSPDGEAVLVYRPDLRSLGEIRRVDVRSGNSVRVGGIRAPEDADIGFSVVVAPDCNSWAYSFERHASDLYMVEGLSRQHSSRSTR